MGEDRTGPNVPDAAGRSDPPPRPRRDGAATAFPLEGTADHRRAAPPHVQSLAVPRGPRPRRHRGPRADQHRQDASRHRADARAPDRHDRAAPAAARPGGLPARRREGGPREGRPRHRRGEDQAGPAALLDLHHRGDAAGPRRGVRGHRRDPARRRHGPRPRLHRPPALRPRPGGDPADRLLDHAAAGPGPDPQRPHHDQAAALAAHLRGGEAAVAAAPAHRHRGVLGRGGLRDRRADPPPARGRRGGARCPVAADPQRPGRDVPGGRRRLPRGHRRGRDGPQSRRRSRRVRGQLEVRRHPLPQAHARRDGPDRGARGAPPLGRHLRLHRPLPAIRGRAGGAAGEPRLRSPAHPAVAQPGSHLRQPGRPAGEPRRAPARIGPDPRPDGRGSAGPRDPHEGGRHPRHGAQRPRGAPPVGRLRRPGLPQGPPAGARRPRGPALPVPHEGHGGPHPRHVVRRAGRDDRPDRRRHRHAVPPDRAGAHLDLRGEPSRLATRPRTLAGRDASGRGQAVRRPARTPREPLRRPAHKRPDAAPEREHDARSPDHRRR